MEVESELRKETDKWLKKAKEKRSKIIVNDRNKAYVKNIDAYISDTEHFLKKNDLIRAFEATIWAFAWIEILEELRIVDSQV